MQTTKPAEQNPVIEVIKPHLHKTFSSKEKVDDFKEISLVKYNSEYEELQAISDVRKSDVGEGSIVAKYIGKKPKIELRVIKKFPI